MLSLFDAPSITAPALLQSFAQRGVAVVLTGDSHAQRLSITPSDDLTDDDRADIRRLKRELIVLLESPDVATVAHRWKSAAPDDDTARARVKPELAQRMDDDDILQLGRLLLRLDAGEEIE